MYRRWRRIWEPETTPPPVRAGIVRTLFVLLGTWPVTETLVLFKEKTELRGEVQVGRRKQFMY